MIFLKLSVKYWREHWKRLLTLITMIVMGAAVLCLTALFIRSDKMRLLNRELDMLGNYDAVFYEVTQQEKLQTIRMWMAVDITGNWGMPERMGAKALTTR